MGNLTPFGTSPFDILFRDFFKSDGDFTPFNSIKVNHPVDIYEAEEGLNIDIACVGLTKKDIDLTIEIYIIVDLHIIVIVLKPWL